MPLEVDNAQHITFKVRSKFTAVYVTSKIITKITKITIQLNEKICVLIEPEGVYLKTAVTPLTEGMSKWQPMWLS